MAKQLSLLKRADGFTREAFAEQFLAWGRDLAAHPPAGLEGLTLNPVDIPAEEAGLRPGGEPAFDAVLEAWSDSGAPLEPPSTLGGACHTYLVEETVEKPYARTWPAGERSPGVKSFFLALRHPSMTHGEMARYWGEQHAPLALRIHVGMWRYTRNVVTRPLTSNAPDWDGMAILHFQTSHDLRERFYDSEDGRAAIAADVAKFSGGGRSLHTSEWILLERR
ncbi:MAG: EthD domain-containing protein [Dehalococcoidia bacterium]